MRACVLCVRRMCILNAKLNTKTIGSRGIRKTIGSLVGSTPTGYQGASRCASLYLRVRARCVVVCTRDVCVRLVIAAHILRCLVVGNGQGVLDSGHVGEYVPCGQVIQQCSTRLAGCL